jgi:hypothetical protein
MEIAMIAANPELVERTKTGIFARVRGLTEDNLFWMRVDVGKAYLGRMNVPPETRQELQSDKGFWNWVQQIWFLNDLYICKHWKETYGQMPLEEYELWQNDRFKDFKINRTIITAARPPAAAK